jgi:hypothetical protein
MVVSLQCFVKVLTFHLEIFVLQNFIAHTCLFECDVLIVEHVP